MACVCHVLFGMYLSLLFDQVMSPHHSDQMSQGHMALGSLFKGVHLMYLSLSLYLYFLGQVMTSHHSDQMSQGH